MDIVSMGRWVQDHPYQTVLYGFLFFVLFVVNDIWHRVARSNLKRKIRSLEDNRQRLPPVPVTLQTRKVYTAQDLQSMHWEAFEQLTARLFERHGYSVQTTQKGGDGGVDIFATQGNSRAIISCKRYGGIVGPDKVRELHSVTMTHGAQIGFLVTSGYFSQQTIADASFMTPRIHLINGEKLASLLNEVPGVRLYP